MAAQAIKSAIPSHLKPGNGEESEFTGKHHGKTRSHMVSTPHHISPKAACSTSRESSSQSSRPLWHRLLDSRTKHASHGVFP